MIENFITKIFGTEHSQFIISKYNESHRYYHNLNHIDDLLKKVLGDEYYSTDFEKFSEFIQKLIISIILHDLVYEIHSSSNEEESSKYVRLFCLFLTSDAIEEIENAIISTKNHIPVSEISKALIDLDLSNLYSNNIEILLEDELKIYKEFQHYDHSMYTYNRIKILNHFLDKKPDNFGLKYLINHVKYRKTNIGIYAGSFNPFHVGHLNILQKAEKIFDKVIIAKGVDVNKKNNYYDLPKSISNRQIIYYNELLTDMVNRLQYPITLIRGLRNTIDFQDEFIKYRYLQDLNPNINVINIICDKEYEHVSSSGIRTLEYYGKGLNYRL